MGIRIVTFNVFVVILTWFGVIIMCSFRYKLYIKFIVKIQSLSLNIYNKNSFSSCLAERAVTFTLVILVVGITLGKKLLQF
jgi:hypothetical protein